MTRRLPAVLLALSVAACASDPIRQHPAYAEVQRQIAEIIRAVRTESGTALLSDLRRLVAYDVFAVDQVAAMARDDNARVRSNAMYVLSQIEDKDHPKLMKQIDESLHDGLDDAEPTVRFEAATGLAARGSWEVLPILIDGLEHPDSGVRYRCHEQLVATTSRDFGFSIDDDSEKRKAAVAQWRAWYGKWQGERG